MRGRCLHKKTKAESKIRNQRLPNTVESRQCFRTVIQRYKMANRKDPPKTYKMRNGIFKEVFIPRTIYERRLIRIQPDGSCLAPISATRKRPLITVPKEVYYPSREGNTNK